MAKGDEWFVPLGSRETEHPKSGEVIYYDDLTLSVLCRKWNWRNGDVSKITERTKRIVNNVDRIGSVPRATVEAARDEMATLLRKECAASLTTRFLSTDQPEFELPFD